MPIALGRTLKSGLAYQKSVSTAQVPVFPVMSERSIESETVLEIVQSGYRRVILTVLMDEQRALTLNELTKTLIERTHQKSVSEVSKDEMTEIRISLYHVHLPKLAEAGFITYDPDRKLAEPTEQLDCIQPQLSTLIESDPEAGSSA